MTGRERSGTEAGVADAPENANEEFGHADQQFGGGAGEMQYGEEAVAIGEDGVVAGDDYRRTHERLVTDDEAEGVALPGTDPDDEADAEE